MNGSPLLPGTSRQGARCGHGPEGFSLLEMMLVVTLILIIASIATPIYRSVVVRAREAVLADHLYPSADGPLSRAPRRGRGERVSGEAAHRPFHRLE